MRLRAPFTFEVEPRKNDGSRSNNSGVKAGILGFLGGRLGGEATPDICMISGPAGCNLAVSTLHSSLITNALRVECLGKIMTDLGELVRMLLESAGAHSLLQQGLLGAVVGNSQDIVQQK